MATPVVNLPIMPVLDPYTSRLPPDPRVEMLIEYIRRLRQAVEVELTKLQP